MNRDILLIVKNPNIAAMLGQQLNNVEVASFGSAQFGRRFRAVIVLDTVDTPQMRSWVEQVAKTAVDADGAYIEVGRTQAPLAAAPQAIPKHVFDPSPMPMEPGQEVSASEVPLMIPETESNLFAQPEVLVAEETPPTPQLTEVIEVPPVRMPLLDEEGAIETDPAIIEDAHLGEE
jgi:hypothetical protein